jgi:hypothetical protein
MPIGPGQTGFVFTEPSIKASAPQASGTYAIYNTENWIYLGETDNIQRRLLEHLRESGTCINRANPTAFIYELQLGVYRVSRQDALILALQPLCNQKLG